MEIASKATHSRNDGRVNDEKANDVAVAEIAKWIIGWMCG